MNDRIATPLPDPLLRYEPGVFSQEDAARLLWLITGEVLGGDKSFVGVDIPHSKMTARGFARAPWAPMAPEQSYGDDIGLSKAKTFGPSIAMLAGVCQQRFGFMPEYASITLLADGSDHLGWHTDADALIGPKGGEAKLATFSFGAMRTLSFAPIGSHEPATHCYPLVNGSAYQMHPAAQRLFQHAVLPEPGAGARLSVTFFCLQRDDLRNIWWTLVDARAGADRPMAAGPAAEIYRRFCELEHPSAVVTPMGGPCFSRFQLHERLRALGMTDREIGELDNDIAARGPTDRGSMPNLDELGISPDTIPIDELGPEWILPAYRVLLKFRCDVCGGVAFGLDLSPELEQRIHPVPAANGCGDATHLCIGCIQKQVKRPLQIADFAVSRINRPILQAFVIGCDHNLLEERRKDAEEMLAKIDALDASEAKMLGKSKSRRKSS